MDIPPWISVTPSQMVDAAKAGTAAGVEIANMQNRAQTAAAELGNRTNELGFRQWELEQNLKAKAEQNLAERQQAAATLEEAMRHHSLDYATQMAGHQAQAAHWKAMEDIALGKAPHQNIRTLPGGEVVQVMPDGTVKVLREKDPLARLISPNAALAASTDPMKQGMIESYYGKDFLGQLAAIAKSGVPDVIRTNPAVNLNFGMPLPGATNNAAVMPTPIVSPKNVTVKTREGMTAQYPVDSTVERDVGGGRIGIYDRKTGAPLGWRQ